MERQQEYDLRNIIFTEIEKDVTNIFNSTYEKLKDNFSSLILYPITALEMTFKKQSEQSIALGMFDNELLILVNPLREATYWYIKKVLSNNHKLKFMHTSLSTEHENYEDAFSDFILQLYDEHKRAKQIHIMRDCSSKVKLVEAKNNTFSFHFPTVSEKYSKEMLYYYGMDDSLNIQKEKELFVECEQYLHKKFDVEKVISNPKQLSIYMNILNCMGNKIDMPYYELCKLRISSDINKISYTTLSSEYESGTPLIKNKNELISVLALFYYLSRICMQRNMFKSGTYQEKIDYYCNYDISKLIALAGQINISRDVILNYIDYLSIDPHIKGGNFTEFPLIKLRNTVLWIPSSIVLNDFQFSIVNGHYYKNIRFISKDDTVSQSIVDYILKQALKYSNITSTSNTLYNVPDIKFKDSDLKSDIDISLFDSSSNTLLVIECKWKENVYQNKDEYIHIEDALKKIYSKQLEKHEFYLNLSTNNISEVFNNKFDFSKIPNLDVLYLFVDKRIQFHDNTNNRHAIPIFMLAYLFDKLSKDNQLLLNDVISEIRDMESQVTYERIKLKHPVKLESFTVI